MKSLCRLSAPSHLFLWLCHAIFLSSTVFGQCNFCLDGSAPPKPDLVIEDFNLPCGILAARARSVSIDDTNPSICAEYAVLGLMCGCPARDDSCTLCEDHNEIPDKGLSIGQNACKELALEGSIQSIQAWNLCPAWRASYGVYCGCDNPVSSEGYCRICGDTLLPDPGAVVEINDSGFEITCADIELNEKNKSCDEIQSSYSSVCCAAVSTDTNDNKEGEDTPTETTSAVDPIETLEDVDDTTSENRPDSDPTEASEDVEDTPSENTSATDPIETFEDVEDTPTENKPDTNPTETLEAVEDTPSKNTSATDPIETLEDVEDTSSENTSAADPIETSDEIKDTSSENRPAKDPSEMLDSTEDSSIDTPTADEPTETLEDPEHAAGANTTVVDSNETLLDAEDTSVDKPTVVNSNETMEEPEDDSSIANTDVIDKDQTSEGDATNESDENDVSGDTEATEIPAETETIEPSDEVAPLASAVFGGRVHTSLLYTALFCVLLMI